ncbi:unnamed protein product [Peniophora sp. CBMAI 1063]|nr:unnamed protein product [Peniophora sp. CBMAI 1063]
MPIRTTGLHRFALLWVCLGALGAMAQTLTVPSHWQDINAQVESEYPKARREAMAAATAQSLVAHVNLINGSIDGLDPATTASLAATLAFQDYYSGNVSFRDEVLGDLLGKYSTSHPILNNGYAYGAWSPDTLHFGLAAYYAYLAYNDSTALQLAVENWQLAYTTDFMTVQRAQSGVFPDAINFDTNCPAKVAGGVFTMIPEGTSAEMSTDSSGMMISLSGYLYNITRNTTYLDSAVLGESFMHSNAYQSGQPIPAGVNATDCMVQDTDLFTWNTGLYLQGVVVLASITGNGSYLTIVDDLVQQAASAAWTSSEDGHITEFYATNSSGAPGAHNAYKGFYVRALAEVARLYPGTRRAEFIQAYIGAQLNAVLNLSSTPDTNFYSPDWNGPPASNFDALGAVAALDVLNPSFAFASDTSTAGTTSTSTGVSPTSGGLSSSTRHMTSTGAIAGGVAGGIVGCVLVIVGMIYIRRRKRRNRLSHSLTSDDVEPAPEQVREMDPHPFKLYHSNSTRPPKGSTGTPLANPVPISAPSSSSQIPSIPVPEGATNAFTTSAGRGSQPGNEVEAFVMDFVSRLQSMVHMRRQGADEEPPRYTD